MICIIYIKNRNITEMQQQLNNGDSMNDFKKMIINFPLKSKMYINMLMSVQDLHNNIPIPKEIKKIYESLLNIFGNLSSEERHLFISKSITFVETTLNNISNHYVPDIKQIQTSCEVKTTFLAMSYWEKKNFKYQYNSLTIKLSGNKKIQTIDLKNYLVRKSKSQSRSLTLESYDTKAQQRLQKTTIKFGNNALFVAIYNNIRDTIINISNRRIQLLLKQQQQNIQSRFGQQNLQNGLIFLDHKTINEYFDTKQKQLQKLKRYRQKIFCIHSEKRFKIYNSSKKTKCYYLQYIFPKTKGQQSTQQYQKCFKMPILKNSQLLQTFTHNISSNYYKWIINNIEYESIMIRQITQKPNYYQQIMKSINSMFQSINIQFINIVIHYNNDGCFQLDMQIIIKFNSKNHQNKSRFVIKLLQSMVDRSLFEPKPQTRTILPSCLADFSHAKNQSVPKGKGRSKYDSFIGESSQKVSEYAIQQAYNSAKKKYKQSSINQIQSISSHQEKEEQFYTIEDIEEDESQQYIHQMMIAAHPQDGLTKEHAKYQINDGQKVEKMNSKGISFLAYKYQQKPEQNYPKKLAEDHYLKIDWTKSQSGGVICINEQAIAEQKKFFKHVFNQLLKMQSAANFSVPIQICKDQSALVSIARNLTYAPFLLENHSSLTPLERIQQVIILQISMASQSLNCKKPLNPVLGQTYQGLIDGCPIYMQQISHHPPITSIYFVGRGYRIYGTVGCEVQIRLNYINGVNDRTLTIEFDNKQKIQFCSPTMVINGMIFGERSIYFQGKNYIFDYSNRLVALTKFKSQDKSKLKNQSSSPDYLDGCVYNVENHFFQTNVINQKKKFPKHNEKDLVSTYYGWWNGQLYANQQKIFDFYENYPYLVEDYMAALPSDSVFRGDVIEMKKGNTDKAQDQKIILEQRQRTDKKLREAYIKSLQKRA